jgi:carboxyl-terminal processing protease
VTIGDDGLKVTRVADDSPAHAAGLVVGDLITKIDGKKADKREDLEGDDGKKIQLEVKKEDGTTKQITVELKRFSTVRKETLTWIGEDTAVLRVFTFAAGYGRENIENLMKDAAKAKYLVLDLRSNGGGAVNNLNHLLSLLMPNGTSYGVFINRLMADNFKKEKPDAEMSAEAIFGWTKQRVRTRARSVKPFEGKVAVLVNRGSASASEICAASLREGVGAMVVGQPSMGAVLASVYARLPEGFSLQHPISDYITDKGVRLEKNPIKPDVEVTGVRGADGKDPVIEKAIEELKKKG